MQGATYDLSTSHIDEGSSRAETYVDLTRGRRANYIFATRREDTLDGEHLPKAPPPPLEATIAVRLSKGAEKTAWELIEDRGRDVDVERPGISL